MKSIWLGLVLLFSSQGLLAATTHFEELSRLFEKGERVRFEEINGWWAGRGFTAAAPNQPNFRLLWAEPKPNSGGPLFPMEGKFWHLNCTYSTDCDTPSATAKAEIRGWIKKEWSILETDVDDEGHLFSLRLPTGKDGYTLEIRRSGSYFIGRLMDVASPGYESTVYEMAYYYVRIE